MAFTCKSDLGSFAGGGKGGAELRNNLERLTREKGTLLAVCTSDYGEMTENGFSTYYEMQEVLKNGVDVLPLRVQEQEDWKPKPPWGKVKVDGKDKDHIDRDGSALDIIDKVLKTSLEPVDCRKKRSPTDIAKDIADILHSRPSVSQGMEAE